MDKKHPISIEACARSEGKKNTNSDNNKNDSIVDIMNNSVDDAEITHNGENEENYYNTNHNNILITTTEDINNKTNELISTTECINDNNNNDDNNKLISTTESIINNNNDNELISTTKSINNNNNDNELISKANSINSNISKVIISDDKRINDKNNINKLIAPAKGINDNNITNELITIAKSINDNNNNINGLITTSNIISDNNNINDLISTPKNIIDNNDINKLITNSNIISNNNNINDQISTTKNIIDNNDINKLIKTTNIISDNNSINKLIKTSENISDNININKLITNSNIISDSNNINDLISINKNINYNNELISTSKNISDNNNINGIDIKLETVNVEKEANDDINDDQRDDGSSSSSYRIRIERPILTLDDFEEELAKRHGKITNRDKKSCFKVPTSETCLSDCNRKCLKKTFMDSFPVVEHIFNYQWRNWLLLDILSGLSGGVIHIPQGLGFALLANLPPVYGLYTSILPGWIYYIFGTSKHLSIGTMAVLALLIGSAVNKGVRLANISTVNSSDVNLTVRLTSSFSVTPVALSIRPYTEITQVVNNNILRYESSSTFKTHTNTINNQETLTSVVITPNNSAMKEINSLIVNIALTTTFLAGIIQLAMWLLRLGNMSSFMSPSFIKGFMIAAAFHIIICQIPFQLGLKISMGSGIFQLPIFFYDICCQLRNTNICALICTIISIILLLFVKEFINERYKSKMKFPVPAELLVVFLSILISHFFQLNNKYELKIVGNIDNSMPRPRLPSFEGVNHYIVDAFTIAVVGFALSISMAKLMGERHNYSIDSNQELFAYGLCNSLGSIFSCFASTQAPPRTMVHEAIGCKSQLAGFVSTLPPLFVLLFMGPLFHSLPNSVLGCVVTCSLIPLLKQLKEMKLLWELNKWDLAVMCITFLSTVVLDVITGLIIGLVSSFLVVLINAKLAKGVWLRNISGTELFYETVIRNNNLNCQETYLEYTNNKNNLNSYLANNISFEIKDMDNKRLSYNENIIFDRVSDENIYRKIMIYRLNANLYFVNVDSFNKQISNLISLNEIITQNHSEKLEEWQLKSHNKIEYLDLKEKNLTNLSTNDDINNKTIKSIVFETHEVDKNENKIDGKLSSRPFLNKSNEKKYKLANFTKSEDIKSITFNKDKPNIKYNFKISPTVSILPKNNNTDIAMESEATNSRKFKFDRILILEVSNINYTDTAGLYAILNIIKKLNANSVILVVSGCPYKLKKQLDILKITSNDSEIQFGKPVIVYKSLQDAYFGCYFELNNYKYRS